MTDMKPLKCGFDSAKVDPKAIAANTGIPVVAFQDDQERKILQHISFGSVGFLKECTPPSFRVMND
jgi:hypothetical protein